MARTPPPMICLSRRCRHPRRRLSKGASNRCRPALSLQAVWREGGNCGIRRPQHRHLADPAVPGAPARQRLQEAAWLPAGRHNRLATPSVGDHAGQDQQARSAITKLSHHYHDLLLIPSQTQPTSQAFMDVKYASKGAGATELKAPLQEAFEAGFFEDKAQFDKALQVGTLGKHRQGAGLALLWRAAGMGHDGTGQCTSAGYQATGRTSPLAAFSSALPCLPALQEEAGIDVTTLGREVAVADTDEGSTLRVFHSQLSTADPALKVRLPSVAAAAAAAAAACGVPWVQG